MARNSKRKNESRQRLAADLGSKAWLSKDNFAVLRSLMKLHYAFDGIDVDSLEISEASTELAYVSKNSRGLVGKGYRFDALYKVRIGEKTVKVLVEAKTGKKNAAIAQVRAYVGHLFQYDLSNIAGRKTTDADPLHGFGEHDPVDRVVVILLNMSGQDWGEYVDMEDICTWPDSSGRESYPVRAVSLGHLGDEERRTVDPQVLLADEIFRTKKSGATLEEVAERHRGEMEGISLELFAICAKFLDIGIDELMDMPGFEERAKERGYMCLAIEQIKEKALAFGKIQEALDNDGYLKDVYEALEDGGCFTREKAKYYIDLYKKQHEGLRIRPGHNNAMYDEIARRIKDYVAGKTGRDRIVAEIAREYGISKEKAEERVACWKGRGRMLAGAKAPDNIISGAIFENLKEGYHEMDILGNLADSYGCSKRQARDAIGKYLAEHPDVQVKPGCRKDYEVYDCIEKNALQGSCENDIVDSCMLYLKLTREEADRYIAAYRQEHPNVEIKPGYKKEYVQKKEAFKLIDVLKAFITSQVEMIQWIVNQVKCTVQMASAYLDEYQQEFGAIPGLC